MNKVLLSLIKEEAFEEALLLLTNLTATEVSAETLALEVMILDRNDQNLLAKSKAKALISTCSDPEIFQGILKFFLDDEDHIERKIILDSGIRYTPAMSISDAIIYLRACYAEHAWKAVLETSEAVLSRADLTPDLRGLVLNHLGCAYLALEKPKDALKTFEMELAYSRKPHETFINIGVAFRRIGGNKLALKYLEKAKNLQSNSVDDLTLFYLASQNCNFEKADYFANKIAQNYKDTGKIDGEPFGSIFISDAGKFILDANMSHAAKFRKKNVFDQRLLSNKKIRIGFLSNDFREHATSFLIKDFLNKLDAIHFDLFIYDYSYEDASVDQIFYRENLNNYYNIKEMPDRKSAELIYDHNIDILVDLKGFTTEARPAIMGYKPASYQVNFLGYPGTMGADFIDYIIADNIIIPKENSKFYQERIIALPCCYQPNRPIRPVGGVTTRSQHNLPAGSVVLASFNYPTKINLETLTVWAKILKDNSDSILWLLYIDDFEAIVNVFKNLGVESSRIIPAPLIKADQHLERIRHADLCLDTFPCGGHTTTSDALYMGVPVLTRIGEAFHSRVSSSIMHFAGATEVISSSWDEYIFKASWLIRNASERDRIHQVICDKSRRLSPYNIDTTVYYWERAMKMIMNGTLRDKYNSVE